MGLLTPGRFVSPVAAPPAPLMTAAERAIARINGIDETTWVRTRQQLEQEGLIAPTPIPIRELLLPGLRAITGSYANLRPEPFTTQFNTNNLLVRATERYSAGWHNPRAIFGGVFNQPASRIDVETAARSKARARGLLKNLLTPEQWAEFEQAGRVTEKINGCEFRLCPGGMIEAKKPRKLMEPAIERWCINPDPYADGNDFMPQEDKLIGQLLHLRAGPEKLRARANVFCTADRRLIT